MSYQYAAATTTPTGVPQSYQVAQPQYIIQQTASYPTTTSPQVNTFPQQQTQIQGTLTPTQQVQAQAYMQAGQTQSIQQPYAQQYLQTYAAQYPQTTQTTLQSYPATQMINTQNGLALSMDGSHSQLLNQQAPAAQEAQRIIRPTNYTTPPNSDERYSKQLIVNYIPPTVTNSELFSLFSRFGTLDGARVIRDRVTGNSKGFGFVYYHDAASAQQAVLHMNGYQLGGKWLKVGYSINPLHIVGQQGNGSNNTSVSMGSNAYGEIRSE